MTLQVKRDGVWVPTGASTETPAEFVTPADGWVRPSYWLDIPEVVATDQVFYGLLAVFPNETRPAGFRAQGDYTIDWGDGSAPVDVASNVTAEKLYDWNALFQPLDFEGAGYTVVDWLSALTTAPAIIPDPTGGGNGNVLEIVKNAGRPDYAGAEIQAPQRRIPFSATEQKIKVKFYSPAQGKRILLRVQVGSTLAEEATAGAYTTVTNGWETLTFDFSAATPALNLNLGYNRLIVIPDYDNQDEDLNRTYYVAEIAFDGKAGQITEQGYKQCLVKVTPQAGQSLTLVDPVAAPVGEHSALSSYGRPRLWLQMRFAMNNAGAYTASDTGWRPALCQSFEFIGNTTGTFPIGSSFRGWRSLKRAVFPTAGSGDRAGVIGETAIEMLDRDFSSVTAAAMQTFATECRQLVSARLKISSSTNRLDGAFFRCFSLAQLDIDLSPSSNEINFSTFCEDCILLSSVKITGQIRATVVISFLRCNLGAQALNDIFNALTDRTSLASREIIITGNPGISQAGYDPSIATGKNWVVTA
jgi:hypothetical protein